MEEIPDDVKILLRATLNSAPGMQQSRIMKEYFEQADERLEFSKYGYRNLYEFLISLNGEVTRLEFSPKHGENLVYAVIDKTKFSSRHAQKYASKTNTGLRSKSPKEILSWKREQESKGILPPVVKKPSHSSRRQGNNRHHNHSNHTRKAQQTTTTTNNNKPSVCAEMVQTISEWFSLRRLLPEAHNKFTLSVRNIGVSKAVELGVPDYELYSFFSIYSIIAGSIYVKQGVTYLSFPTFFTAYRAWKEKDQSIVMGRRIGVEPAGGNVNSLSTRIYNVTVLNVPEGVFVSTFVTRFMRFRGLVSIDPHPRENYVVIGYSISESAHRACTDGANILANGRSVKLNIQLTEEKSFPGASNNDMIRSLESVPQCEESGKSDSACMDPEGSTTEGSQLSTDDAVCGVGISYRQWFDMFQIMRRQKPKRVEDLPDEIQFFVTHQSDCIRFWGWIVDIKNAKKLAEIEGNIASTVSKVQPPTTLPKPGTRGAALFKDDSNESWFRCFVLSSNAEMDEIEVFYCDYGNSDHIHRERFRSTYSDVWTLNPQAVPFKIHGFEVKDRRNNVCKSTPLFNLLNTQPMEANVVKNSSYSQAHIVEIKNVKYVSSDACIDNQIIGEWCVPIEDLSSESSNVGSKRDKEDEADTYCDSIEVVGDEQQVVMDSIFDYDEEKLVLGILCVTHNPSLFYLRLGDISAFHKLQIDLDALELKQPTCLDKGIILLLVKNSDRRRVLVLQVFANFSQLKVLHVDYGVIDWVQPKDLYELSPYLQGAPFQARPASLAGIDCSKRLTEATNHLISKSNIVIKANVIHENRSGKVSVELFEARKDISINKELIDNGLAVCCTSKAATDTDEEFTPEMLKSSTEDQTQKPKISQDNLHSNIPISQTSQQGDYDNNGSSHNDLSDFSNIPKLMEVSTWLVKSPLRGAAVDAFDSDFEAAVKNNEALNDNVCDQLDKNVIIKDDHCHIKDENRIPHIGGTSHNFRVEDVSVLPSGNAGSADILSNRIEDDFVGVLPSGNACSAGILSNRIEDDFVGVLPSGNACSADILSNRIEDDFVCNLTDNKKSLQSNKCNGNILDKNFSQRRDKEQTKNDTNFSQRRDKEQTKNDKNVSQMRNKEHTKNDQNVSQMGDKEQIKVLNNNPFYPPPDIISSNAECSGSSTDTNHRTITFDNNLIDFGTSNQVDADLVFQMRYKWQIERSEFNDMVKKLMFTSQLSPEELKKYYIYKRKEMLQLKLRIKLSQRNLAKVESDITTVNQETNKLLATI